MVSILMPAYNASRYIGIAIESVIRQAYQDWELIIVDDKSLDNTYEISLEFSKRDQRIKVYQLEKNSGSAQRPRLTAEHFALGSFICFLDADDELDPYYLYKLINRQSETGADAVIGRICHMNEFGEKQGPCNPKDKVDVGKIVTGREAFSLTVGDWYINGLGIFKKEICSAASKKIQLCDSINADEIYTRLKFLTCSSVAFTDADYFYRENMDSITRKISIKFFDSLDAQNTVKNLSLKEFGRSSNEYERANFSLFKWVLSSMSLFWAEYANIDAKKRPNIKDKIRDSWHNISLFELFKASFKHGLIYMFGFHLIDFIFYLRNYVSRR